MPNRKSYGISAAPFQNRQNEKCREQRDERRHSMRKSFAFYDQYTSEDSKRSLMGGAMFAFGRWGEVLHVLSSTGHRIDFCLHRW